MAFARYKGEAEKALLAAGFPPVYIFRPAYIYPVESRKEPNLSYRVLRAICPAFRVLFANQVGPTTWAVRWSMLPSGEQAGAGGWFSRTVTSGPWSSRRKPRNTRKRRGVTPSRPSLIG
jgi:hypothetical protein